MLRQPDNKASDEPETSVLSLYIGDKSKKILIMAILAIFLFVAILYSGSVGSANLSIEDVFLSLGNSLVNLINGVLGFISGFLPFGLTLGFRLNPNLFLPHSDIAEPIVMNIRLPRIVLAILTGVALAISGAVMQGTLRNPLVDPFTLGLASAAAFGAALVMVIGPEILGALFLSNQNSFIIIAAFLFGLTSMLVVYLIMKVNNDAPTLILAGVVMSFIFSAGLMMLQYISNNEELRSLMTWLMGGMWGANWGIVLLLIPMVFIAFSLLWIKAWDLNAITTGDEVAKNLGVNVDGTRIYCLLIATFISSCCLAFTGIIGFIGLMSPHICRMLIGYDYRYVIPGSALIGALILLLSDTFSRTIMSPVDLPVGIVMYVIGGIFFLYLVLKGRESRLY